VVGKDFNFIKSEKNDQVYKWIVSCDGDASKEGYPHTLSPYLRKKGEKKIYFSQYEK
jgi:hypothetical protein